MTQQPALTDEDLGLLADLLRQRRESAQPSQTVHDPTATPADQYTHQEQIESAQPSQAVHDPTAAPADQYTHQGQTERTPRYRSSRRAKTMLAPAIAGMAIGGVLWILGAQFTLDGMIIAVNWLLARLNVPYAIGVLPWWLYLGSMLGLGYLFSRVEVAHIPVHIPWRTFSDWHRWRFAPWQQCFTWIIIAGIDLITTYVGVANPPKGSWAIFHEIGATISLSAGVSFALTFVPEHVFLWGRRNFR